MMTSVSTQALATAMVPALDRGQAQLSTLGQELSSGHYADFGLQLGEQAGQEIGLRDAIDRLIGFVATNSIVGTHLGVARDALDSIRSTASSIVQSLAAWGSGGGNVSLASIGQNGLNALIATANTSSAGVFVFAGENSGAAPLADYFAQPASAAKSAIDAAFTQTFGFPPGDPQSASISSASMQSFLSGPFAALFQGSGWSAWSSATDNAASVTVAPGETAAAGASANAPGFKSLAMAYAMLSEFGSAGLNASTAQTLASAASTLALQGGQQLISTESDVGLSLQTITSANSALNAQVSSVQSQVGALDNVDVNAIAAQLGALQTQMQEAYDVTSRIHSLNLAQFLPVA